MRFRILVLVLAGVVAWPPAAAAFCGFYVASGDAKLFNDATQVVLMRSGTTTVLSMQNNYSGPAEQFAMIIPVKQVLKKGDVKTLPKSTFDKIDRLSAPRLVELWETDPCRQKSGDVFVSLTLPRKKYSKKTAVKIEAEFAVGEYEVVVLSATDSTGLEEWLSDNQYKVPAGADPYFRPYIESGHYFFVARVNLDKVKYENGRAVLSPLRFQYTSDNFELPIRLGMINSNGQQDLIIYVLAPKQRYEVANYPNVTIPTNLDVHPDVRDNFSTFYRALFAATLKENPGAVVTEYVWNTHSCDPCPGPGLNPQDLASLGADIITGIDPWTWTLTRLHARFSKTEVGEDLVFKKAAGINGGREVRRRSVDGEGPVVETGATPSVGPDSHFQGRYIIRHEWDGEVECRNPNFGGWGGPPEGGSLNPTTTSSANTLGRAPLTANNVALEPLIQQGIPELGLERKGWSPITWAAGFLALAALIFSGICWRSEGH